MAYLVDHKTSNSYTFHRLTLYFLWQWQHLLNGLQDWVQEQLRLGHLEAYCEISAQSQLGA